MTIGVSIGYLLPTKKNYTSCLIPSCSSSCIRTPAGVQSLAALLIELQPGSDGPQILAADALYQLNRVEEAYRLLLSVGPNVPRAPILARLTMLQLRRGFLYDTNQVRCSLRQLELNFPELEKLLQMPSKG